ncbi:hypothetical protein MTO96_001243 [Rhipicephalus appendiculatus]
MSTISPCDAHFHNGSVSEGKQSDDLHLHSWCSQVCLIPLDSDRSALQMLRGAACSMLTFFPSVRTMGIIKNRLLLRESRRSRLSEVVAAIRSLGGAGRRHRAEARSCDRYCALAVHARRMCQADNPPVTSAP